MDAAGMTFGAPDDQQLGLDLAPGLVVRRVHLEVATGAGAVVLARAADRFPGEATDVFGERVRMEKAQSDTGFRQFVFHVVRGWHTRHHPLRHVVRLNHEQPMPRFGGPRLRGMRPDVMVRQDINHRSAGDPVGMVEAHARACASATIVAGDHECAMAEAFHHLDLIQRHRPE
jgi:hypothetical protein